MKTKKTVQQGSSNQWASRLEVRLSGCVKRVMSQIVQIVFFALLICSSPGGGGGLTASL